MIQAGGVMIPSAEDYLRDHLDATPGFAARYDEARMRCALELPMRRLAIDVGANIGLWTRRLAEHFAGVEAFEPYEPAAECFRENVRAPNVRLHGCALGERNGATGLVVNARTTQKTYVSGSRGPIELRTLDSFAFAEVDFIKVDCEGFDYFVLCGATETLARCAPAVLFEAKPGVSLKRYKVLQDAPQRFLEGLGYALDYEERGNYFMRKR